MVVLSWLGRFLLLCNIKKIGANYEKAKQFAFFNSSSSLLECGNKHKRGMTDES